MRAIEIIAAIEFIIIVMFCFDWWQRAGEEARKEGAVKDNDRPIVVWPGDPDYSELTDLQIDPHGFHEECGDR